MIANMHRPAEYRDCWLELCLESRFEAAIPGDRGRAVTRFADAPPTDGSGLSAPPMICARFFLPLIEAGEVRAYLDDGLYF